MMPDECGTREGQLQKTIFQIMQQGGYWDAIMNGDSELDRVKVFLQTLAGEIPAVVNDMQKPNVLPIFPGLNYQAVHDKANYPWAAQLENAFTTIRDEILNIPAECGFLGYEGGLAAENMWSVIPMYYMGTPIHDFQQYCPKTVEIVKIYRISVSIIRGAIVYFRVKLAVPILSRIAASIPLDCERI